MGAAAHLLIHTITIAPPGGVNDAGEPTVGAQTTIKARWQQKTGLVVTAVANERRYSDVFLTEDAVDPDSFVWLPGEDTTAAGRRILTTRQADTTSGYRLYEVYL